jgi:hypothetical protein
MFGHPKIYFGEFERLSEQIQEPEHLISAVASIHRLTPQHATDIYHEWSKHTHRHPPNRRRRMKFPVLVLDK